MSIVLLKNPLRAHAPRSLNVHYRSRNSQCSRSGLDQALLAPRIGALHVRSLLDMPCSIVDIRAHCLHATDNHVVTRNAPPWKCAQPVAG